MGLRGVSDDFGCSHIFSSQLGPGLCFQQTGDGGNQRLHLIPASDGDAVVVPGTPKKPSDANYCYVFVGWDKSVTNCYGDAVYTAKFTASDLPIATVNNSSARATETVVVNILLSGAPNLGSLAISDISYNTSAFELLSVDWKVADAILSNWDAATGKGALTLSTSKDINGTIISLTFKAKDGTADGNYPVSCTVTSQ